VNLFVCTLFLPINPINFTNPTHPSDFLVQLKGYDSDPHEEEQKRKQEEMQKQQQQQHMNSVPGLLYTGPSSGIEPKELMD